MYIHVLRYMKKDPRFLAYKQHAIWLQHALKFNWNNKIQIQKKQTKINPDSTQKTKYWLKGHEN